MGVWNAIECWFLACLVLRIRSSVGTLALPLRPLYSNISLLSFLLFLRDSHFNCPKMCLLHGNFHVQFGVIGEDSQQCSYNMGSRSFIKMTKSSGPKTLPWEMPLVTADHSDLWPFTITLCFLPTKKAHNQRSMWCFMPTDGSVVTWLLLVALFEDGCYLADFPVIW